ncbi:MAG: ECF-type sigma factor [Pirellulaceae bacterium]|jgi:DNA-directed RNA polymerase specialized sigma24 family protein|nr:ECF-type sigma factor [Pirellulaceae bacterium]MDP7018566.1 ECF-type sigma factor [Pirellulaceae bacterium]
MTDWEAEPVTLWIAALKEGSDEAAAQIWQRFFDRLTQVARRKLGSARRVADEEDVALSVFDTLCRGAEQGRFTQLRDRDDLWRLLVRITAQKSVDQLRRAGRQKRGGGDVRGHSVFGGRDSAGFEDVLARDPSPDFLAALDEHHQRLFDALADDTLRQIAQLRMAGDSNEEIADALGVSLRTVERKLGLIRTRWSRELGE